MDFLARYAFPLYVFYGISSFFGFMVYFAQNGDLVVAFFCAVIAGTIFLLISAVSILPLLFIAFGLLASLADFVVWLIRK